MRLGLKADSIADDDAVAKLCGSTSIASAAQNHGKESAVVYKPVRRREGVDGLMTDVPDLTLFVRVADCQSFVFYDPHVQAAGILHAGWRGLVAGAIPQFIDIFQSEWQSDPRNIFVGAGPSLCQKCSEFTDPLAELPGVDPRFFEGRFVDLRGIADQQLSDAGILHDHIERLPDCTKCRNDLYWSYRGGDRDAVKNGFENVLTCTLIPLASA